MKAVIVGTVLWLAAASLVIWAVPALGIVAPSLWFTLINLMDVVGRGVIIAGTIWEVFNLLDNKKKVQQKVAA